jgi:hypothetical protein
MFALTLNKGMANDGIRNPTFHTEKWVFYFEWWIMISTATSALVHVSEGYLKFMLFIF